MDLTVERWAELIKLGLKEIGEVPMGKRISVKEALEPKPEPPPIPKAAPKRKPKTKEA